LSIAAYKEKKEKEKEKEKATQPPPFNQPEPAIHPVVKQELLANRQELLPNRQELLANKPPSASSNHPKPAHHLPFSSQSNSKREIVASQHQHQHRVSQQAHPQ